MTAQQTEEQTPAAAPDDSGAESTGTETEFDAESVLGEHGVQVDDYGFGSALLAKVPGLPAHDHYMVPFGYQVSGQGVWFEQATKDNVRLVQVSRAPLLITQRYIDAGGALNIELAWRDGPRTVTGIVPRSTMLRGRTLVAALGDTGFPAGESDARMVERWLGDLEATNRHVIPETYLARWLGWQPDGTFVTSPTTATVDAPHTEPNVIGEYKPHGNLAGWQQAVKLVEGLPRPRVAVAAGFAAPLLRLLGVKPFTVDFSGRSTGGKTTAAQGATSQWGNPAETSPAFMTWQTTLYGIEKRLTAVRGMPVLIDETMLANPEHLETMLYQLPSGRGKSRGGDYASGLEWDTVLITTGERNALAHTTKQGAAARTVEVTGQPFDTGETATRFRAGVEENYGLAGPAFVEYVLARLRESDWLEKLKARHASLAEAFLTGNPIADRRAPSLAALALGEEAAYHAGILPYEPMPVQQWLAVLVQDQETDDRPTMALDVAREYIASHPNEFHGLSDDMTATPVRGWSGALKKESGDDGREYIAFLPKLLEEILDKAGYKLDAVVEQWMDSGHLKLAGEKQRPRWKPLTRIGTERPKCVCFWRDVLRGASPGSDGE